MSTVLAKNDFTVGLGEERVIASAPNILASVIFGAALADQNVASRYLFATISLDAQSFRFRIATVACATACFLMCHFEPLMRNFYDLHCREVLSMSLSAQIVLSALELDDANFVASSLLNDLAFDTRTFDKRRTDLDGFTIRNH